MKRSNLQELVSQIGQVCDTCFKAAWQIMEGSSSVQLSNNEMKNSWGNVLKLFSSY